MAITQSALEKLLNGGGMKEVWKLVFEGVASITGPVDVVKDGTLVEQIANAGSGGSTPEQIQEALKIIQSVNNSLAGTQLNVLQLEMILQTMTSADVIASDNAVIELFDSADDVTIEYGSYDASQKAIVA